METAQAELATLRDPNVSDLPARAQTEVLLRPFTRGFMAPEEEWAIHAALLGLLLFLLVMAGNLSNLLLARNSTRMREIALRFALGAKRSRLVRQLLAEAALLGAASAGFGLLVARGCVRYVEARVNDLPWWFAADVSTAMVGAAALAALVASAAAGISPAAKLTRHSVSDVLKQTGAVTGPLRFGRLGNALIAAQMAIAIGLVSAVGLLAQSLFGFGYEKYGLPAREVLVTQLYFGQPEGLAAGMPAAERRAIWKRFLDECHAKQRSIQERVAAIPGVGNAAYASLLPGNDVESARIELHADLRSTTNDPQPLTRVVEISPAFFDVLGARFVQGRDFLPLEHTGEPRAVIVNAPFARKHFGGAALGRRLRLVPSGQGLTPQPWVEVVGVVPDLGLNPGDPENADGIYLPLGSTNVVRLAIRSQGEPSLLVAPLHEIVALAAPRAQVQWAVTLQKQLQEVEAIFRGLGSGLLLIGGTALLLTAVSLYSLISFSVTQRTREIGVRLALGASRSAVLRGVFRREGVNVVAGTLAGAVLALAVTRLLMLVPFGMRAGEPMSLIACIALLAGVGCAACFAPLRRALRIQP
ncbi:MAG: FtsX-like permease family protein, partial [Candidatus Acidiferrales bacterium]